jgi:hypothetical protein
MATLRIQLRIKCDRTIEKGEILQLNPDEVYTKAGYNYDTILMIETTINPIPTPKEYQKAVESLSE